MNISVEVRVIEFFVNVGRLSYFITRIEQKKTKMNAQNIRANEK